MNEKTIKIKSVCEIPENYTGIIERENGNKGWLKNGKWHREDGPAYIWYNGFKEWYLDGILVWKEKRSKIDLRTCIVLSKESHPEYPSVQVWRYIDEYGIRARIIVPGMEEYITE